MPLLLRFIRKSRWYGHEVHPWLPAGSLQADALLDLKTTANGLSMWQIKDDKSNLKQVITAHATTRDHVSNSDYAIFDQQLMSEIDVKIKYTMGNTSYENANPWHRDLPELSAEKLMGLARVIMESADKQRFSEKRVLGLLKEAVVSGDIDLTKLKDGVKTRISGLGLPDMASP
ncbi:MAG: hypothetical protein AAGB97_02685 [Dehalococcoidia bacterium]|nr:hypothetical protein [Chloroflexota bacterium]MBT9160157.1 hypothetical protein [Chloroflexota bacterium]MBT9162164.1 hypothetical protein [Chloroflexota bacterium]